MKKIKLLLLLCLCIISSFAQIASKNSNATALSDRSLLGIPNGIENINIRLNDTLPAIEVFKSFSITQYEIVKSKIDYVSASNSYVQNFDIYDSEIRNLSFRLGKYDGVGLKNLLAKKSEFLYSNSKIIKIDTAYVNEMTFFSDTISNYLFINALHGSELKITESVVNVLKVKDIDVKRIVLDNTTFKRDSQISGRLSGSISLKDIEFENNAVLDFRHLRSQLSGKRIDLDLISCPIDRILIDYRNFKLVFKVTDGDLINGIYENLLENFKRNGQSESYQLLDIEYKSYQNNKIPIIGALWDKCNLMWWNYGYSRERVILCTLFILIFLSIINVLLYKKLNAEVYNIENFKPFFPSSKPALFTSLKYSLIYTTLIFFKFDVSIERLKLTNSLLLAWFALIYFSGLFCTFFILNAILKI